MRLVVFCLAVLSSNSDVVHVNLQIVATTHCPDTFVEGGPNLVNCTIYGDRVTCSPTPKKIPIILTQNGIPGVSANPDYPPTCNPDVGVIPNGEAKCTKKDGNTYTYVYKFMGANKTHKRDTLQCKVPCFGVTPDIGNACEITFEEPTEVGSGTTDTNCNNRGTNSTSSDGKGSSSSNLGLIIGATAGGVVVVAMAIGISIYCYKKRSSGVTTPPPIVGPASHPADRGVAATLDVKPTEEEAGENDSEASEATDVSETSEEP